MKNPTKKNAPTRRVKVVSNFSHIQVNYRVDLNMEFKTATVKKQTGLMDHIPNAPIT